MHMYQEMVLGVVKTFSFLAWYDPDVVMSFTDHWHNSEPACTLYMYNDTMTCTMTP